MRLLAALLPPQDVQDDLAGVVASVPGGREHLTLVPADRLHLRLANFGKVTLADSEALRRVVEKELLQWPAMTLRFRGGVALEPIGDDSAWAKLEGDIEQLTEITDFILRLVKRLGFLVDRRLPRTLVRVGRITPATTADYLQQMIDRLDDFTSREWICRDVALLRVSDSGQDGASTSEVMTRLRLGSQEPDPPTSPSPPDHPT